MKKKWSVWGPSQRKAHYSKNFGMTVEQYDAMLASQGGKCKGCNRPPTKKRLAVDHDHRTGRVRGLLCWACNRALGYLRDNAQTARNLAEYLDYHKIVAPLMPQGKKGPVR